MTCGHVNMGKIPLDPPFSKGEGMSPLPLFEKEGLGEIFLATLSETDIHRSDRSELAWNYKN